MEGGKKGSMIEHMARLSWKWAAQEMQQVLEGGGSLRPKQSSYLPIEAYGQGLSANKTPRSWESTSFIPKGGRNLDITYSKPLF